MPRSSTRENVVDLDGRSGEGVVIATAVLGTANLFGLVDDRQSYALLRAGLDAGFTNFDTAPSYGRGRSEAVLGRLLAGRDGFAVTTKVGLEAPPTAPVAVRALKAFGRRLPPALRGRLRRPAALDPGRFSAPAVRASVDRSLRRLGRVDVLLLHEVLPAEIDDRLLAELDRLRRAGDVGAVGVATSNELTGPCLALGPELFTHANVSVDPGEAAARAPVPQVVGHGALGPGGAALRRLRRRLQDDASERERWEDVVAGTPWAGPGGPAAALLGRAAGMGLAGVVVTSSRPARLAASRRLVEEGERVPAEILDMLGVLVGEPLTPGAPR